MHRLSIALLSLDPTLMGDGRLPIVGADIYADNHSLQSNPAMAAALGLLDAVVVSPIFATKMPVWIMPRVVVDVDVAA